MDTLVIDKTKYAIAPIEQAIATAIWLGLVLLPFSTGKDSSVGVISLGLPFAGVAALLSLLRLLCHNVQFPATLRFTLLLSFIFVALTAITSFLSPAFIPSVVRVLPHVIGYLVFLFIASFAAAGHGVREHFEKQVANALALSGVVMAAYYLINMIHAVMTHSFLEVVLDRIVGGLMALPWGASNTVAACLLIPLIVIVSEQGNGPAFKLLKAAAVALLVVAILATESRTVFFALLFLFTLHSAATRDVRPLLVVIALVAVTLAAVHHYYPAAFDVLYTMRMQDVGTLTGGRAEIWDRIVTYLRHNPLLPVGFYGSQFAFRSSGHNVVVTTLAEMGVVGLLTVAALFVNLLHVAFTGYRNSGTRRRMRSLALFMGLWAILLNLSFEDPQFTQQYILYFWVFAGTICLSSAPEPEGD